MYGSIQYFSTALSQVVSRSETPKPLKVLLSCPGGWSAQFVNNALRLNRDFSCDIPELVVLATAAFLLFDAAADS